MALCYSMLCYVKSWVKSGQVMSLFYTLICYVMPRYVKLWYIMLNSVMLLCYIMMSYIMPCYVKGCVMAYYAHNTALVRQCLVARLNDLCCVVL